MLHKMVQPKHPNLTWSKYLQPSESLRRLPAGVLLCFPLLQLCLLMLCRAACFYVAIVTPGTRNLA
jgi:hypothetical protein